MILVFQSILLIAFVSAADPPECCYTGIGEDYRGSLAKASSRFKCLPWADKSEAYHKYVDQNFCRNPSKLVKKTSKTNKPWCYTKQHGWQYCGVSKCTNRDTYEPTGTAKLRDCKVCCYTGIGQEYTGTDVMANNGKPCLVWEEAAKIDKSAEKYLPHVDKTKNYCRNPSKIVKPSSRTYKPWCYTEIEKPGKKKAIKWKYCNIPRCNNKPYQVKDCKYKKVCDEDTDRRCPEYTKGGKCSTSWTLQEMCPTSCCNQPKPKVKTEKERKCPSGVVGDENEETCPGGAVCKPACENGKTCHYVSMSLVANMCY